MKPRTAECLAEIRAAVKAGQTMIAPSIFSHCFGRAACSAAFRIAKAEGLIEVAYTSVVGTPVYQPAGLAQAIEEAKGASFQ